MEKYANYHTERGPQMSINDRNIISVREVQLDELSSSYYQKNVFQNSCRDGSVKSVYHILYKTLYTVTEEGGWNIGPRLRKPIVRPSCLVFIPNDSIYHEGRPYVCVYSDARHPNIYPLKSVNDNRCFAFGEKKHTLCCLGDNLKILLTKKKEDLSFIVSMLHIYLSSHNFNSAYIRREWYTKYMKKCSLCNAKVRDPENLYLFLEPLCHKCSTENRVKVCNEQSGEIIYHNTLFSVANTMGQLRLIDLTREESGHFYMGIK